MLARITSWLLGLERVVSADRIDPELGARWLSQGSLPFWICLAVLLAVVGVFLFYLKFQPVGPRGARIWLASMRAAVLLLLVVTLLEPALRIAVTRWEPPELFLVFDGTASMTLRDSYSTEAAQSLSKATGLRLDPSAAPPSRLDLVSAWLRHRAGSTHSPGTVLNRFHRQSSCRIRAFEFDGVADSRLREIRLPAETRTAQPSLSGAQIAEQLSGAGQVTALGNVLRGVAQQPGRQRLAGIILFSDFVHNTGPHPLGAAAGLGDSPAGALGVPIHSVTVGAPLSRDIAVTLETEPRIRRGEKTLLNIRVQQTKLLGETARLRVQARPSSAQDPRATVNIADRQVLLESEEQSLEVAYTPQAAGVTDLLVEVDEVAGEVVTENNRASQRIQVIDDFIRLLYVAHEPTWEWRFMKEVFHRDPAVGLAGFRTYLASSDPRVRQSNPLFVPTLIQPPEDFYATDVICLDDFPATAIPAQFYSMLKHFVAELGGGLVVIAGPRFGPQQLAETPLADMLPVIIDPHARLQDKAAFALRLTDRAAQYRFMQLDDDPGLNAQAWDKLRQVPWYQPVAHQQEQATVLAEHPTDTCADGKTPQPLIAIRRYGAGEVLYLGFNEMWRLRRLDGDKHYRRFWLPVIDRLGLSHALGAGKRFVVRTDRSRYHVHDDITVTVHAYDELYQPLVAPTPDAQHDHGTSLVAELVRGADAETRELVQTSPLSFIRPGVFEVTFPHLPPGSYLVRIMDPVTGTPVQQPLEVTDEAIEMLVSTRNDELARQLSEATGGTCRNLTDIAALADQLRLSPVLEQSQHVYALWNTPLWFTLIVGLLLGEWSVRKWFHLI